MKRIVLLLSGVVTMQSVLLAQDGSTVVYKSQFDELVRPKVWWTTKTVRTPKGGQVLLGDFGRYGVQTLTLSDLPKHKFLRFKAKLHLIRALDGNVDRYGPDFWTMTVKGGGPLLVTTFSNRPEGDPGQDVRQSWPDEYPFGKHKAMTGAVAKNRFGFVAGNLEGKPELDSTYEISVSFPHRGDKLELQMGSGFTEYEDDESWALGDVVVEALAGPGGLDEEGLAKLWDEFSGNDPVSANQALWSLVEQGDPGIKYVRKRRSRNSAELRNEFEALLGELAADEFVVRQNAKTKLRAKASSLRPLIEQRLENPQGLEPAMHAALSLALKESTTELFSSRLRHLMRVAAFAPGLAQDERDKRRLAASSKRAKDGSYTLEVKDVAFSAEAAWPRYRTSWNYLEGVQAGVSMSWDIAKPTAGPMQIQLEYSCHPKSSGSTLEITAGEDTLKHEVVPTADWHDFQSIIVGEATIPKGTDVYRLTVRTAELKGYACMNLIRVKLVAVKE